MTNSFNRKPCVAVDGLSLMRGGGVVVAKRLALALAESGIEVHLLCSRRIPAFFSTDMVGISVHYLPAASGAAKALMFRFFKADKFLNELAVDAVIGFNYYVSTQLPQLTYHINIIPFLPIAKARSSVGLARSVMQKMMARRALHSSTANFFESEYVLSLARSTGSLINAPAVAYIGVDTGDVGLIDRARPDHTKILCITSGATHKRNDEVLQIFLANQAVDHATTLTFLGDPEGIKNSLSMKNRDIALSSESVIFAGYLERQELISVLRDSTALVTASELESFHMVAVEAMAAGCPAIAADLASARESVGVAGMVYQPDDIESVVAYLTNLKDPGVWLSQSRASMDWAQQFQSATCVKKFVLEFRAVIGI